jgi:hypothetical protein
METKRSNHIKSHITNNRDSRKFVVAESITKLQNKMIMDNSALILQGKSPFVRENDKLLYFRGFIRNTIFYTKKTLISKGIPKESFIGKSVCSW